MYGCVPQMPQPANQLLHPRYHPMDDEAPPCPNSKHHEWCLVLAALFPGKSTARGNLKNIPSRFEIENAGLSHSWWQHLCRMEGSSTICNAKWSGRGTMMPLRYQRASLAVTERGGYKNMSRGPIVLWHNLLVVASAPCKSAMRRFSKFYLRFVG